MMMTCLVCKGKGWYTYNDHTPEGWTTYRQKCMSCQPDATMHDYDIVRFESHTPGHMEDRETRIASGWEVPWQAGDTV